MVICIQYFSDNHLFFSTLRGGRSNNSHVQMMKRRTKRLIDPPKVILEVAELGLKSRRSSYENLHR